MTLTEAERRARSNLYRLDENAVLLEHKEDLAKMIHERGSRVEQQYGEKPGRKSARYVETVPSWFLAYEDVEQIYWEFWSAVSTVQSLLKYLQECEPEPYELYAMKYRDKSPLPELRRRFARKLKTLDRRLIFELILWHSWPIDRDGGEEYEAWLRKKGY